MDQSIINFKVYEDSVEYVGMAQATLPDLTALTQSISGAGIAGNVESVILGHFDAMTLGLNFRTVTDQSVKLSEPRRHTIDLRVAQQDEDVVAGKVVVRAVKHILVVIPKSDKGGSVAPAAPSNGSGEYAVRYWATYIDGKKVREVDQLNFICYVNGTDYLADVRKALQVVPLGQRPLRHDLLRQRQALRQIFSPFHSITRRHSMLAFRIPFRLRQYIPVR